MRVLLDGNLMEVERGTLAAALSAAAADADARGRVIIDVLIDGVAATSESLANPSDTPGAVGEVVLTSADPGQLVRASLRDAADALDIAVERQRQAGELVQAGRVEQGLEHLAVALKTWEMIRAVLDQGAALARLDITALAHARGLDAGAATTALADRLTQLKLALEGEDLATLSDLLLYDMADRAREWRALLNAVADQAAGDVP